MFELSTEISKIKTLKKTIDVFVDLVTFKGSKIVKLVRDQHGNAYEIVIRPAANSEYFNHLTRKKKKKETNIKK